MYIFPLHITYFCSQLNTEPVGPIIMGNLSSACRKVRDDFNDAGKPQVRITLISADHPDHPDYEPPQPRFEGHQPLPLLPPLPPVYSTNSPPPYVDPPRYSEIDRSETRARRVRAVAVMKREREREGEVNRRDGEGTSGTRHMRNWGSFSVF